MKKIGFDHCVIAVSDWARSDAFYSDVLRAEVPPHGESWGQYRFDGWKLNVHGPGLEALKARKPVEPGNSDLCFVWPGPIEEAVEHLARHGVEVEVGPIAYAEGGSHLYFRDPDGSLLEFVSYA
jgi:catechol 2,3-dioxygenase-like lactoylglutathione lyase family enzyme